MQRTLGCTKTNYQCRCITRTGRNSIVIYRVRICNDTTCNKLVISSDENCITNNLSWPTGIKDTLPRIGMLDKFLNKDDTAHVSSFQRLCDIFHQNTFYGIKKESSKLRTYSLLKTQIGHENYLSKIENIQRRTAFTKLRLSNHCLEIEKGRQQRIDKNNRFCPFCSKSTEDENTFCYNVKSTKSSEKHYLFGQKHK